MTLNVNKNTEFWHGTWVECPTSGLEVQGSSPCAGMEELTSLYVNSLVSWLFLLTFPLSQHPSEKVVLWFPWVIQSDKSPPGSKERKKGLNPSPLGTRYPKPGQGQILHYFKP